MLPVAERMFSKGGERSGFNSTKNTLSARTNVPFVLPSKISLTQPTHCGRGMIVPVNGGANVVKTVTHNLGRKVQVAWALSNGGGNFPPKVRLENGVSTLTQQNIVADEVMNECLILFF